MKHSSRNRPWRLELVLLATWCVLMIVVGTGRAQPITIATVPVGNPKNVSDPATGFGSVAYSYNIGEYDVTAAQYTAFLNAVASTDTYGVYNSSMAGTTNGAPGIVRNGSLGNYAYSVVAGRGNYPVTDVSFWDATRFANWLDNGQPIGPEGPGTTETGTYTLTPTAIANNTVARNPNSTWAIANDGEWYKAAYYSPTLNSGAGGYWLYPTQSNTISPTQANYYDPPSNNGTDTTSVGDYAYPSYYGTYDQGGDVFQWNEGVYDGQWRVLRGGSFNNVVNVVNYGSDLQSGYISAGGWPQLDGYSIGFRVSELPEPASISLIGITALSTMSRPKRAQHRLP